MHILMIKRESVKMIYKNHIIVVVEVSKSMRLPGVEPGSIAWKAIILTVGLQTLDVSQSCFTA